MTIYKYVTPKPIYDKEYEMYFCEDSSNNKCPYFDGEYCGIEGRNKVYKVRFKTMVESCRGENNAHRYGYNKQGVK